MRQGVFERLVIAATRVYDWAFSKYWDSMRPRAPARGIPRQAVDTTGNGWGRRFEQAVDDVDRFDFHSYELIRSSQASGDQRWTAMIWDGNSDAVPTVMETGPTPDVALAEAARKFRSRALAKETKIVWIGSSPTPN